MHLSARMQAVQQPIIPVVAESDPPPSRARSRWARAWCTTVRRREAADRIAGFLADPQNHKYKPVEGIRRAGRGAREETGRPKTASRWADSSRVVVTAGGNMAFFNALLAIADPGDEIILLAPYYFNHEMAVAMLNCRAVLVPLDANYQIDLAAVERAVTPRTRAIVTISPNNPTGAVYSRESLTAVNDLCREQGIYHISDEAYEYFVYDGARHFSPGSLAGRGRAHDLALLAVEGLRLRQLAGRLHGDPRGAHAWPCARRRTRS